MKKYWFTSDLHLSHSKIIDYCNRPFKDAEEMNETIISNWNNVVAPDDVIYLLGDVAFEKDRAKLEWLLSRLQGEKHLVWGNHDKLLRNIKWQRFFKTANEITTVHVPPESNDGVNSQSIVLMHYAMRVWNKSHFGFFHCFGHSHGTLPDDPNSLSCDVGVDNWNFTPVSMEQLRAHMAKKTFKPIDHHRGAYSE